MEKKNYIYLFGKKKPCHQKTLIRIVNEDIAATCKICKIADNISSHSFRIGVISRLLRVSDLQTVANIIGHTDVRSTQNYDRYRLSKHEIQNILTQSEF